MSHSCPWIRALENERALSGQRSEAAHLSRVMPHTLPKGVHSLCALKKPKFLPQYVSPMLEKLELSIDERSLTWIRQHC